MREYKGYRAGYVTVAQAAYMLNDHIEEVISYLGLSGSRQGDSLWIRNPTRNDHNPSLQIRLKGESKGKWKDQATDDRGDALSLLCYIRGIDNKLLLRIRQLDFKVLRSRRQILDFPLVFWRVRRKRNKFHLRFARKNRARTKQRHYI